MAKVQVGVVEAFVLVELYPFLCAGCLCFGLLSLFRLLSGLFLCLRMSFFVLKSLKMFVFVFRHVESQFALLISQDAKSGRTLARKKL